MKANRLLLGLVAAGLIVGWGTSSSAQRLEFVEAIFGDAIVKLKGAAALSVSPDGGSVYVASFDDGAVVVFSRDPSDGTLTFVESVTNDGVVTGIAIPTAVAVSPDGAHVYVTSRGNTLAIFARNAATSELSFVGFLANRTPAAPGGLASPTALAVSGDGAFVYVTGDLENTVSVFARDAATGTLTFVDVVEQSIVDGIVGISGARAVAISPDGAHLYVPGPADSGVGIFARDAATGMIEFVSAVFDGVDGVDGLDGASAVAVSADGANVYVVGPNDAAVAVFARDAATGELTFTEIQQNGFNAVEGLLNPRGVAASADGTGVFATGFESNAAVSFARDADTGALTFASAARDGENGVTGLEGATGIAVSPNPDYVYVASPIAGAVTVFAIDPDGPPPIELPEGPGLIDARITYQYRWQEIDGDIFEGPTPFTVGDGVDLVVNFGSTDLDISEDNLKLTWTSMQSLTPANFNGHIYSDATGALPAFESVTINPETTIAFDESRLSFDEDNIWLNLAGVQAVGGDMLSLDIALVPEPGTGAAVLAAAATLTLMVRRRRRSSP